MKFAAISTQCSPLPTVKWHFKCTVPVTLLFDRTSCFVENTAVIGCKQASANYKDCEMDKVNV